MKPGLPVTKSEADAIPSQIQDCFFSDISAPSLLEYDAVGFSADNCFVKYRAQDVAVMIVENMLDALSEVFPEYPATIEDFDCKNTDLICNGVIWDIPNGAILKLGENREVLRAICGYETLKPEKIKELYGEPPVFKNLKWPNSNNGMKEESAYWTLMGFIDCCKIPLICHIVDQIKKGKVKGKSYLQFAFDLGEINYKQFQYFDDEEVKDIKDYGTVLSTIA
jgi:hypothetical protein